MSESDFTENMDISSGLSPQDVAEMEARLARVEETSSPESRAMFARLREGSQERIEAMLAGDATVATLDLSTAQGHIDAITFLRTSLIGIAGQVHECARAGDQVGMPALFEEAHQLWEPLTPAIQFNLLLEFLMMFIQLHDETRGSEPF